MSSEDLNAFVSKSRASRVGRLVVWSYSVYHLIEIVFQDDLKSWDDITGAPVVPTAYQLVCFVHSVTALPTNIVKGILYLLLRLEEQKAKSIQRCFDKEKMILLIVQP